jgi:hypothetical protein
MLISLYTLYGGTLFLSVMVIGVGAFGGNCHAGRDFIMVLVPLQEEAGLSFIPLGSFCHVKLQ